MGLCRWRLEERPSAGSGLEVGGREPEELGTEKIVDFRLQIVISDFGLRISDLEKERKRDF